MVEYSGGSRNFERSFLGDILVLYNMMTSLHNKEIATKKTTIIVGISEHYNR